MLPSAKTLASLGCRRLLTSAFNSAVPAHRRDIAKIINNNNVRLGVFPPRRGFFWKRDGKNESNDVRFRKDQIPHEDTEFKGEDLYGNRYYEAPRVDSGRYLKTHRWMEPGTLEEVQDDDFDGLGAFNRGYRR